jgi:hypothetical protein
MKQNRHFETVVQKAYVTFWQSESAIGWTVPCACWLNYEDDIVSLSAYQGHIWMVDVISSRYVANARYSEARKENWQCENVFLQNNIILRLFTIQESKPVRLFPPKFLGLSSLCFRRFVRNLIGIWQLRDLTCNCHEFDLYLCWRNLDMSLIILWGKRF